MKIALIAHDKKKPEMMVVSKIPKIFCDLLMQRGYLNKGYPLSM